MTDDGTNEILTGFTLLKDASREELIDEILSHQREMMTEMDINQLRVNVIDIRVNGYKRRLCEEAGVMPIMGILGQGGYAVKDDDDD